jgi:hypothetical protein
MFIPTSHLRRYILELEEDILEREEAHVEEMPLPNLLALDNEESVDKEQLAVRDEGAVNVAGPLFTRSFVSA